MHDHQRHIPVRVFLVEHDYADGGLVSEAEAVRRASRNGDSMVVHINKEEFDELRREWGDPTINPETGMPEFFIKKLWKKAKKYVAPVAGALAGAFVPGIGNALSSALPGLAGVIGSTGMQALGAAGIGAGIGALTNGGKGALYGALAGAGGALAADAFGNIFDTTTGQFIAPAGVTEGIGAPINWGAGSSPLSNLNKEATLPALGAAALNMYGNYMSSQEAEQQEKRARRAQQRAEAQFNKPLPVYTNTRRRIEYAGAPDYTVEGERNYYEDNDLDMSVAAANGGYIKKYQGRKPLSGPMEDGALSMLARMLHLHDAPAAGAQSDVEAEMMRRAYGYPSSVGSRGDLPPGVRYADGGEVSHGRSDDIEARLSEGEYVIDAETVALLGNGSSEAGAAQLDRLRQNIRKHKGGALAAGAISPDAMPAEAYLGAM